MSARRFFIGTGASILAIALCLRSSGTAQAQLNKVDQKCRNTISKSFAKTVNSAHKVGASCHKLRNLGKLPPATECNDVFDAQTDNKGKFSKAQQKLEDSIFKSCTDKGASPSLVDDFISCPEPCATSTGVPNPMVTFADVGECLACLAGDLIGRRNVVQLDDPAALSGDKDLQKCHAAIAKNYGKHLSTLIKERQNCQKTQDKEGNNELQPCDTSDLKQKIAAAVSKAEAGLDSAGCGSVNLADLGSCDTTLAALKGCLLAENDARGTEAFAAGYELPATICPSSLTVRTHAGTGMGGATSVTSLDAGWNGIGHGQDLLDLYTYGVDVSCVNTSPPCGTCTITSFNSDPQPGAFTRCRQDTRQVCTNPFGVDGVCPGLQECGFYLGPPLPLSASNTPVCVVIRVEADASGSADIETGDSQIDFDLRAVVHTGLSLTKPCPRCVGDVAPHDGVAEGLCEGGSNNGGACDVQGFDATFGDTSMDCPPVTATNISGQGLRIVSTFGTGTSSMPFGTKCDFPLGALDCACAVCSGDETVPCNANADCAAVLAGTCTAKGANGQSRAPNACSDLTCTDHGSEHGECDNGPDVKYCDGQKRANGKGFISCNDNADCAAVNAVCDGGDCGTCELEEPRACYLNPIVGNGVADPDSPILAGTFCVPPTTSTGVNAATGQPGPSRAVVQIDIEREY